MKFKDYIKLGMGFYIGWTVMKGFNIGLSKAINDMAKDKPKEE